MGLSGAWMLRRGRRVGENEGCYQASMLLRGQERNPEGPQTAVVFKISGDSLVTVWWIS